MSLILIVDDDAHIRSVVRFALESAGLRTFPFLDRLFGTFRPPRGP